MEAKVVILAMYFGKSLPSYIDFWLSSCGRNPEFTWVLVTDCSVEGLVLPHNVKIVSSSLLDVSEIIGSRLDLILKISHAYKLCDLRPAHWMVLDHFGFEYDFWGHCDLDVIFGRLSKFITDDLLKKHDRIFGMGHLSIVRNSPIAKLAFLMQGSEYDWEKIFTQVENVGFDEHFGANMIWRSNGLPFYENENSVADFDPQFNGLILTKPFMNKFFQRFEVEDGAILQKFSLLGLSRAREFAYMHFQKRSMKSVAGVSSCSSFKVEGNGFFSVEEKVVNGGLWSFNELIAFLKLCIRVLKRKVLR